MRLRSIALAALATIAVLLLGGCGEGGQNYDRIYDEVRAEQVDREHAEALEALPHCTSLGNRVVNGGPCVYGGARPRGSFGMRPAN